MPNGKSHSSVLAFGLVVTGFIAAFGVFMTPILLRRARDAESTVRETKKTIESLNDRVLALRTESESVKAQLDERLNDIALLHEGVEESRSVSAKAAAKAANVTAALEQSRRRLEAYAEQEVPGLEAELAAALDLNRKLRERERDHNQELNELTAKQNRLTERLRSHEAAATRKTISPAIYPNARVSSPAYKPSGPIEIVPRSTIYRPPPGPSVVIRYQWDAAYTGAPSVLPDGPACVPWSHQQQLPLLP